MVIALFNSCWRWSHLGSDDASFLGYADLDQEGFVKKFAKPTTALPEYVRIDGLLFKYTETTHLGCPAYLEVVAIEVKHLRSTQ